MNINNTKIIKIIVFIIEIIGSIIIAILAALWDEVTLSKGIALLSSNISILVLTSQFLENISFSDGEEQQFNNFNFISSKLSEMEERIEIDEIYKKIYEINNDEQKSIYIDAVKTFADTMNSRIEGARSGALSRHAYYMQLQKAADTIEKDYEDKKSSGTYSGGIWAMTVWQDDELDFNDAMELSWIKRMAKMDNSGIKTERICIMKNKLKLLKSSNVDEEVTEFLKKLLYYCSENSECPNTVLYAIDSIDNLNKTHRDWINKGFFATKLSDGKLRLIRGVSLDDPNATTLGGEIDFDENRVKNIKKIWDELLVQSGRCTMLSYMYTHSSEAVKKAMEDLGFPTL